MEIIFNNLTPEENKIAVDFLREAEAYFETTDSYSSFTHFYNLFNSVCHNRIYDPSQFVMEFKGGPCFTQAEQNEINDLKTKILENRKIKEVS